MEYLCKPAPFHPVTGAVPEPFDPAGSHRVTAPDPRTALRGFIAAARLPPGHHAAYVAPVGPGLTHPNGVPVAVHYFEFKVPGG